MTLSIAQRRALKAARRGRSIAKKRRHDGDALKAPSVERVRRWAAAPIHCCLIHDRLFEMGFGVMVLTRRVGTGELAAASFLVDIYCCGIKDAVVQRLGRLEFEGLLATFGEFGPNKPVEPSYARKLLHDLAEYANSIGFLPHRDFAVAEELFGDVRADACDAAFRFGHDGKPLYMAGPYEFRQRSARLLTRLRKQLGDGGFAYIVPADETELIAEDRLAEILFDDEMSPREIPF